MRVGLALSKLPIHFFGTYQHCIPLLPLSVLDLNRFQYCFHETALCLSLMNAAMSSNVTFPLLLQSSTSARASLCTLCHFLHSFQNSSVAFWQSVELPNCYMCCPSNYIQIVPNLRVKNWYVTSAIFIGHKAPVFFSLTRLKSVGGWKSLSALKRDSSLPCSWSRSWLLWGCQYWSSYISGCQATHADG